MARDIWLISNEYKEASIDILVENLPSLRAKIGITQEELASVIGVSRQTYYPIETGNKKMTWTMFLALIFFFDNITETAEMIKELNVFPIDLMVRFNESVTEQEVFDNSCL